MTGEDVPATLRKLDSELRYRSDRAAGVTLPLHQEQSQWAGRYWRIIANRYPPDAAFKPHRSRLIVPKRVFGDWWKMRPWEAVELALIMYRHRTDGSQMTINLGTTRSVPGHFHIHLNEFYDTRNEMGL